MKCPECDTEMEVNPLTDERDEVIGHQYHCLNTECEYLSIVWIEEYVVSALRIISRTDLGF
jgi:hypothetical protein